MAVTKLVLVRHGESQWNNENRFTGWYDVDLSDKALAKQSTGKLLKAEGFSFDFAYTSVLKRAIHTHCGTHLTNWIRPGCHKHS